MRFVGRPHGPTSPEFTEQALAWFGRHGESTDAVRRFEQEERIKLRAYYNRAQLQVIRATLLITVPLVLVGLYASAAADPGDEPTFLFKLAGAIAVGALVPLGRQERAYSRSVAALRAQLDWARHWAMLSDAERRQVRVTEFGILGAKLLWAPVGFVLKLARLNPFGH
jgi:hypothetical protein